MFRNKFISFSLKLMGAFFLLPGILATGSRVTTQTPLPSSGGSLIPLPVRIFYVSPKGLPTNNGSVARPLDLATALSANSPARPGDAIYLRGGLYDLPGARLSGTDQPPFVSRLTGTEAAPIQVRQFPGEQAMVNGGIRVEGAYTWYIDFEITNYHPDRTVTRPTGMNVYGHHIRLINMVIHDCGDAIGFWQSAVESEIYGCILYRNGWDGPTDYRGNGHGIYIQNRTGSKKIIDNISFNNYATGMKAYSEAGYVIGILFKGNFLFNNGSSARPRIGNDRINNILVGSAINPADQIWFVKNLTYHPLTSKGPNLQFGYVARFNQTAVIQDNYFVGGGTTMGYISNWNDLQMTRNAFIGGGELLVVNTPSGKRVSNYTWNNNTYYSATTAYPIGYKPADGEGRNYTIRDFQAAAGPGTVNTVLPVRPANARIFFRQNRYDPNRTHIAVYNWGKRDAVQVDFSGLLRRGDRYHLRNVQKYFGPPLLSGVYNGNPVAVPMKNVAPSAPEFNVFILVRN
jgi:hypothetical protein